MAQEGTYEYACMRAELLGLDKPDHETFLAEMKERMEMCNEEEIELNQLDEIDSQEEGMKNISGGLDELNSILSLTQRKLNRFKTVCGSLTNVLKIKVGYANSTESLNKDCDESATQESVADGPDVLDTSTVDAPETSSEDVCQIDGQKQVTAARQRDFGAKVSSQVDSLDALLTKAENAHYSMSHQNKQMKSFLK